MFKQKVTELIGKIKVLLKAFFTGIKEKKTVPIAILLAVSLVVVGGVSAVGILVIPTLPAIRKEPPEITEQSQESTDTQAESESETEEQTESSAEETETESESTDTETEAPETTQAPETTTPPNTQSSENNEELELSWGDVSESQGSSKPNELGSEETGGRVHTYVNAPINEYEDTSNTLEFYPLRKEGATEKYGPYNIPKIKLDDIKPGVFLKGDSDYSSTLIGYDGFLFCQDSFADYDGTSLFNANRLEVMVQNMVKRNEWVESLKGSSLDGTKKMYILFIPNKNSVYYDYMPESYTMGEYRRIDQIIDALRGAGLNVIDGRDSLLAAKAENPQRSLYYKTDTHWNNHGGFFVYQQLMNEIKKDFPNVVVHDRSDYQINYCETYMKDQAYYLGYYDATSELGAVYTLKNGKSADYITSQHKDKWGQFAFCYEWDIGYSDHLYWYQWRNDYNRSAPSMYMLRDSYSIALNGFLKDSFYKSTYNWTYNFSKKDVTSSGADVIIIEVVEKYITNFANAMPFTG